MIHLYHCINARSFRPLWALEELEIPYQLHILPFPPRFKKADYLKRNPLGTVPFLEDGDVCMTESSAMCEYLSRLYGNSQLSLNVKDKHYGAYLNWLFMSDSTLTFPQTLVLRYSSFESFEPPERQQPQLVEDYSRWFLARLRTVNNQLEHELYLCDNRFTIADIAIGYALLLSEYIGLAKHFKPQITDYLQRLKSRPGFQRAIYAQEQAALAQGVNTRAATELDFKVLHSN